MFEHDRSAARGDMYVQVAVETPQHAGLGGTLDYLAPVAWPAAMIFSHTPRA